MDFKTLSLSMYSNMISSVRESKMHFQHFDLSCATLKQTFHVPDPSGVYLQCHGVCTVAYAVPAALVKLAGTGVPK